MTTTPPESTANTEAATQLRAIAVDRLRAQQREARLRNTTDAHVWANEFMEVHHANPLPLHTGDMIGWFANAIEVGRDAGRKEPQPSDGRPTAKEVGDQLAAYVAVNLRGHHSLALRTLARSQHDLATAFVKVADGTLVVFQSSENVAEMRVPPVSCMDRALAHDDLGGSAEMCTRCGWVMGHPPLNCQNDNTPHVFPSQLPTADRATLTWRDQHGDVQVGEVAVGRQPPVDGATPIRVFAGADPQGMARPAPAEDYLPLDQVTMVRLFQEGNDDWTIDGYDAAQDRCTEACWSWASLADALDNVPRFIIQNAPHLLPESTPLVSRTLGDVLREAAADLAPGKTISVDLSADPGQLP